MSDCQKIKKLICIGSNCIAADIMASLKIRFPSPVDNISAFNIWKSHLLFSGRIKKALFHEDYEVRPSTQFEKETYFYWDKIFTFNHNFLIVHNNFETKKFKKAILKRIKLFKIYYNYSKKDNTLWYVYCLNWDDEYIDETFMKEIVNSLPACCRERLICIAMRGKNVLFEKYFKYYIEFDEKAYCWHSRKQALEIIMEYEKKYNLKFQI